MERLEVSAMRTLLPSQRQTTAHPPRAEGFSAHGRSWLGIFLANEMPRISEIGGIGFARTHVRRKAIGESWG